MDWFPINCFLPKADLVYVHVRVGSRRRKTVEVRQKTDRCDGARGYC